MTKKVKLGNINIFSKITKKYKLTRESIIKKAKEIAVASTIILTFTAGVVGATAYSINVGSEVIDLTNSGVSTKDAIIASVTNDYIQPELRERVAEMDNILEKRFPDVKFNDSGSVVLSSDTWEDDNLVDDLAGFYNGIYDVAVFNEKHPDKQAHENLHRKFRHDVTKEDGTKEGYNGLQRLTDGKGDKLAEALTTYLEQELYGTPPCYIEYMYLEMMFHFISEDELVKIAAEGSMEDLEALLAPYFDVDIIDMIDKTPGANDVFIYGADYVIDGLNERACVITDAFFKSLDMRDLTVEEKKEEIESFRAYLSKNFVKSVDYFDEVVVDYVQNGFSR